MAKVRLVSNQEVLAEVLANDEGFAREWERLRFARLVATKVIGYRSDHGLSQRGLARRLGISQPQLARLEAGTHDPSYATLMRLAGTLKMRFSIEITPAAHQTNGTEDPTAVTQADGGAVLSASAA